MSEKVRFCDTRHHILGIAHLLVLRKSAAAAASHAALSDSLSHH